jgi:Fe-S cluster biogenesis protein NfuA
VSAPPDRDYQGRVERVEALVRALEACPDAAAREGARELVRALLDLHAAGLTRMLDLASQAGEPGRALVDRLARDGLVGSLLLLHGLHPVPVERRVAEALERVRPSLRRQGGDVELLEATGGVIRVRLRGDQSAGPWLRHAVEEALTEAAADVPAVAFEEAWDLAPSGRVPLPILGGP